MEQNTTKGSARKSGIPYPVIATVCVKGRKAWRAAENARRLEIVDDAINKLDATGLGANLDAVLFPGGYFRHRPYLGTTAPRDRAAFLETETFVADCRSIVQGLTTRSHAPVLIVGSDSTCPRRGKRGDQLALAIAGRGLVGHARKVFPADLDTTWTDNPIYVSESDFDWRGRFINLASGRKAVLCSCYDMFGLVDALTNRRAKEPYIRYLHRSDGAEVVEDRDLRMLRRMAIGRFVDAIKTVTPTVALATIHSFRRPGSDIYWQRHGLAAASAALEGATTLGAAHFRERLPSAGQSSLAASLVPRSHLKQGNTRPYRSAAHRLVHQETISKGRALLRVFQL